MADDRRRGDRGGLQPGRRVRAPRVRRVDDRHAGDGRGGVGGRRRPDAPGTTLDLAGSLRACEDYVPRAAFTGDLEMQQLWAALTRDPSILSIWCRETVQTDPARIAQMASDLAAMRSVEETAATEATAAPTPPAPDPTPTATVTVTIPGATALPSAPPVASTNVPAPSPVARGVMPDVVCRTLLDAKQLLADAAIFASVSFDASGAARPQESDAAWVVVTQSPLAGSAVGDRTVRLGVLETDDPSRC